MLNPEEGNIYTVDVDITLGARERAVLSAYIQQEGFDVLQIVMENVVRSMNRQLVNTPPEDEKAVIARHRVAHAAGRFYVDLMTKLKDEYDLQYRSAAKLGTVENPENPNVEDFR